MEPYTHLEEKLFWSFCDKIINIGSGETVKGQIFEKIITIYFYKVVSFSSNNKNKHKYM